MVGSCFMPEPIHHDDAIWKHPVDQEPLKFFRRIKEVAQIDPLTKKSRREMQHMLGKIRKKFKTRGVLCYRIIFVWKFEV